MRRRVLTLAIVASSLALLPAAAHAATSPTDLAHALPMGNLFDSIKDAVVGSISFTAEFFSDMFMAIFGGLADLLIPDSWAKKGTELLTWLVAAADFSKPAFKDLHTLSHISVWVGLAMLPVTLGATLGAPSLGLSASSDNPGEVIARTLTAAVGIALWPTIWQQGAAISNQISAAFIMDPIAIAGMNAYMELIAVGGMLGGIPFLGVLIVLFGGAVFLSALVLKVFLLILQAVLYIGVPLLLGVVATRWGSRMVRVAATAMLTTWLVPILWGLIMVASGVMIHRAPAIGAAIGGKGSIASTGGMLVAGCAAIAGPLLCTALAKSALGPLGAHLGALSSAMSPGRLTARASNGASAVSRAGAVGGAPRATTAATGAAAGPAGAMQRLMQARLGAVQAARAGAASARPAAAGANPNPIGDPRRLAATMLRGGAAAVAGAAVGRVAGHAQTQLASAGGMRTAASGVGTSVRDTVSGRTEQRATQSTQRRDTQADSAARQNMRPPSGADRTAAPSADSRSGANGATKRAGQEGKQATNATAPRGASSTPAAKTAGTNSGGAGRTAADKTTSSTTRSAPRRSEGANAAPKTRRSESTSSATNRAPAAPKTPKSPKAPKTPGTGAERRPRNRPRPTNEPGLES